MKKRILIVMTLFITLINICTLSFAEDIATTTNSLSENNATNIENSTIQNVESPNFQIYSDGAVLIDAQTGNVLAEKDMNQQLYPASTTKILTAILAIENLNLDDVLTASSSAVLAIPSGYSNAGISAGEQFSVQDLLDMFLIHSANEIGYIFAEEISGSIEDFADLMNQKATELGCENTHFTNPSGIHDVNHYTTAYDMALIAKYCMQNDIFRSIVCKTSCTIEPTEQYAEQRYFKNTNHLLLSSEIYYYEYAIGVKTGFTSQAKNCLIAASLKDGVELIAVMLGAEATETGLSGRYVDAINLFDYGYENYQITEFISANTSVQELTINNATTETKTLNLLVKESLSALLPTDYDVSSLEYSIEINDNISAPIAKDTVLGKISYTIDGVTYSSDLIASNDVEKSTLMITIIQIIFAILVLLIFSKLIFNNKKSYKRKLKLNKKKRNDSNSIYKFEF